MPMMAHIRIDKLHEVKIYSHTKPVTGYFPSSQSVSIEEIHESYNMTAHSPNLATKHYVKNYTFMPDRTPSVSESHGGQNKGDGQLQRPWNVAQNI